MLFEFRLARELGRTRDELLQSVSQSEFNDWLALQAIDPFYDGWTANAVNCQVTAAAAGNKVSIHKFLPNVTKRKQRESEMKSIIRGR